MTPAAPLAGASAACLVSVSLSSRVLPPGAPGEAWLHLAIYAARQDIEAIVRAQPTEAFAVASVTAELRPLHGQAAWLRAVVPVHDDPRLVRDHGLAAAAAATLGDGGAMLLRGDGAAPAPVHPSAALP